MSDLNPLLQRLALLQLSVATVWLLFLGYLQNLSVPNLEPAWLLLGLYLPILLAVNWQGARRSIKPWQLFLYLMLECQLLTGLLFFTGGATNPLISYYLVLLVLAAYGLPGSYVIWITLLGVADYSLLNLWYQPLLLPHQAQLEGLSLMDWHLAGMWLTFVISVAVLTTLIPLLVRSKQRQQQEIQQLREQQLKNEQLVGIGTLAAGTAHEMGTPLMTMNMLLDDMASEPLPEVIQEDIDILKQQVERCQTSLRALSERGRHVRQTTQVDALDWLQQQLHQWQLSHPNACWEMDTHDLNHGQIRHSPLLDQALLNLLDNAAEAGQHTIQLSSGIDLQHWLLNIHQPDPNAAEQLTQGGLFASAKTDGMGMGMYLSNASVEQFGGSIHLQALPDGSSLCQLRLPLTPDQHCNTR
jgi:two-component system sensor histidine kinase RegB